MDTDEFLNSVTRERAQKKNKKRGIFACGIRMNYAHGFSFLQIKDGKILQAAEKLTRGILDVDNFLSFITSHNLIPAHVHNFETVDDGGIEQCDDDDNDEVVPLTATVTPPPSSQNACEVCLIADKRVLAVPCAHLLFCSPCWLEEKRQKGETGRTCLKCGVPVVSFIELRN